MANQNEVIVTIKLGGGDKFKRDTDSATKNFASSWGTVQKGLHTIAKTMIGIGVAAVGAFTAISKNGLQVAADLETAKLGFVTLLGSTKKADTAIQKIIRDAANTPFEVKGLVESTMLMTTVTKDADKARGVIINVGKALAAAGKGQAELDRIIVNLQQIGSLGKASLLDIKQFAYAGIPIYEMLEKATGKSGTALAKFISDGRVSFGLLEKMFQQAGAKGGRFEKAFSNQMGTMNQSVSNLKDSWNIFTADFVVKSGLFDTAKKAIQGLTQFINDNKSTFISWGQKVTEVVVPKLSDLGGGVQGFINKVQGLDMNDVNMYAKLFGLLGSASIASEIIESLNPVTILIASLAANFALAYENGKKFADWMSVNQQNKALDKQINKLRNYVSMKGLADQVSKSPLKTVITSPNYLKNPLTGKAAGGIIEGNSYYGDKVLTRTNSGEMVLNREQQSGLFGFLKKLSSGQNINFNAPINFAGNAGPMQQQNNFTNMLRGLI